MKKTLKITIISIIFLLIISLVGFILWKTVFDPHRGVVTSFENTSLLSTQLTQKEALEDLDFVYKKL